MKKILFLTYAFPPKNNAAAHRILKLASGLFNHGICPYIITSNPSSAILSKPDFELIKEIPNQIPVLRIKFLGLFEKFVGFLRIKDFFIPDVYIEWIISVIPFLLKYVKRKDFDVIYASGPPFSIFLLGYFTKIFYNKPLVLAYRDPWTDNPYHHNILSYKKKVLFFLEKFLIFKSDGIVFISEPLKKNIKMKYSLENYPGIQKVIPSATIFRNLEIKSNNRSLSKKMHLVLTSTIYGDRNPKSFFMLLSKAKKKEVISSNNFEFDIYGSKEKKWIINLAKKFNIEDLISVQGHISHNNCIKVQNEATLLVDISEKSIDYPSFPYHLWEYFGSGKKILFLGKSKSFKAKFIKNHNLGYILPLDEPKNMEKTFLSIIQDYFNNKLEIYNNFEEKFIKGNSWEDRVKKIEEIFYKVGK